MTNKKDIRIFAAGIGIIFQMFALVSWRKGGTFFPYLAGFGVFFAAFGLAFPSVMVPLYRRWMVFAAVLGRFQTMLFLMILFFLALTPLAVLLRATGRDALDLSINPGKESYWKKRPPLQDGAHYEKQF